MPKIDFIRKSGREKEVLTYKVSVLVIKIVAALSKTQLRMFVNLSV